MKLMVESKAPGPWKLRDASVLLPQQHSNHEDPVLSNRKGKNNIVLEATSQRVPHAAAEKRLMEKPESR
jgi:hypothetical protein